MPLIYGSFTDWKPMKMFSAFDYLQFSGPKGEIFNDEVAFKTLKKELHIKKEIYTISQCSKKDLLKI